MSQVVRGAMNKVYKHTATRPYHDTTEGRNNNCRTPIEGIISFICKSELKDRLIMYLQLFYCLAVFLLATQNTRVLCQSNESDKVVRASRFGNLSERVSAPKARTVQVLNDEDEIDEENIPVNDGMIGIVPELFKESDDSKLGWPIHNSIKNLLSLCRTASKCEECPFVATNSRGLLEYENKTPQCDVLSHYNYEMLRYAQEKVGEKQKFVYSYNTIVLHVISYSILLLMGGYLIWMKHFRLQTLWDSSAKDPTQGMRSYRYERMEFTFDPDDPGARPDDLKGYEDWEVYNSDDEGAKDASEHKEGGVKREHNNSIGGPKIWPWELPGYDFSHIPYRDGTQKHMDDWRPDDDSIG